MAERRPFSIFLARFCINMYSHDIKLKIDICCVFCSLWFAPLCAFADMGASQTWALLPYRVNFELTYNASAAFISSSKYPLIESVHTRLRVKSMEVDWSPIVPRTLTQWSQLCGEKRGDSDHDALVGNFYLNNLQSNLVLVTYQNNWRSKPNWS